MTNVLLITADDMDGRTPAHLGGPADATPNLNRLAAQGITFERSHVAIAVCQPSRSAIMTGMWPHRNGAQGFEPIHDGIGLFTDVLHDAGYLAGILGKTDHIQPVYRFGWDKLVSMRDLGLGRNPEAYGSEAAEFFRTAREAGKPWFLMTNAHDPHRPFHGSIAEREKWEEPEREAFPDPTRVWTAAEVEVPGFLPDLPGVREEYAQYLSSARRCDDVVGAVLTELEQAGYAEDTLVVFLSDNGMAFPFAKANCYLRSTLTPLIVRWPGVTQGGQVEAGAFVSSLDLFPTFCDALGIPSPEGLDGSSLLPVIQGRPAEGRDRVFTVFHETSAKIRYEMRCVQDEHWGYIWNAWADEDTAYRAENMDGLSWPAMQEAAELDERVAERARFYRYRAPEELYDLKNDPNCLQNLAGDSALADVLDERRRVLQDWMNGSGDPLASAHQVQFAAAADRSQRAE
jgi:N-sulfoglucosamine sulfohydrolase